MVYVVAGSGCGGGGIGGGGKGVRRGNVCVGSLDKCQVLFSSFLLGWTELQHCALADG